MKVTAICPTYNRRQYIPQMIACFLSQTLTDSELVILDDGTDSIADLVPDNPRIKYIRVDSQMSVGEKRNTCCEQAAGEFIVHLDDDDWSAPGRFTDQVAELERTQKPLLTYYNIPYWDVDSKKMYRFHPKYIGAPHGASFCYRKSWWQKHKFDAINVGEDTHFGQAAYAAGQLSNADAKNLMVIRAHNLNTCTNRQSMGTVGIPLADAGDVPYGFPHMSKLFVAFKTCFKPDYTDPKNPAAVDWRDRNRCFESDRRRNTIRETWLKGFTDLGIEHKFFFGQPPSPEITPLADEVFLDCGDAYFDVSYKAKAMCQWVLDHGYDYMMLSDDDVYIYPDRILKTDWANFGYSGAACCDFIIGCCVFLNREAMEILATGPITHWMDDAWFGQALRPKGILPHILPNMHCFIGEKYNVDPSKIPVEHSWSVFHVCSPEAIRTFWDREHVIAAPTPVVVEVPTPVVVAPILNPPTPVVPQSIRRNDLVVDWWDTPAGKKMRAEQ
jgi:glycosyltransferase involved in cell wall biosynthesis